MSRHTQQQAKYHYDPCWPANVNLADSLHILTKQPASQEFPKTIHTVNYSPTVFLSTKLYIFDSYRERLANMLTLV